MQGALNLSDLKMTDQKGPKTGMCRTWKMTDQIAGLENAWVHANDLFLHFPAVRFGPSFSRSCTFSRYCYYSSVGYSVRKLARGQMMTTVMTTVNDLDLGRVSCHVIGRSSRCALRVVSLT